jgi:phage protein U
MATNVLMTLSWLDENGVLTTFPFSINTAAWERLSRIATRRWESQDVIGARPLLQDTGKGLEQIRIDGTQYPHWRGGLVPLSVLRGHVLNSGPAQLIDGRGNVLGFWALMALDVRGDTPTQDGVALRQTFTLDLAFYSAQSPLAGAI